MMKLVIFIYFFLCYPLFIYSAEPITPSFGDRIDLGLIENIDISEASGIAASIRNPGVLWTHNDSDDMNRIFAFNTKGKDLGIYYLENTINRDWEDMAMGPGPAAGEFYLYIGDFGDNSAQNNLNMIYRVVEPHVDSSQLPVTKLLGEIDKLRFIYPDGKRDAESLMIDPITKDLYIVSKREPQVRLYRLAYPQAAQDTSMAEFMISLNLSNVVGGDISNSGQEILLKTYTDVFYWNRMPGQAIWEALQLAPITLPYILEPQGEAICWLPPDSGYVTLSEEAFDIPAHLYFYPRLEPNSTKVKNQKVIFEFYLEQNYPNPFNTTTFIRFRLNRSIPVTLEIFDLIGEKVITIFSNRFLWSGQHQYEWDAGQVASGTYICRLKAGDQIESRKIILNK